MVMGPTGARRLMIACTILAMATPAVGSAQDPTPAIESKGDSVALRFVDADLRAVVSALAPLLPKPVVAANLPGVRVSLESPGMVPVAHVVQLLQGLAGAYGLELVDDGV